MWQTTDFNSKVSSVLPRNLINSCFASSVPSTVVNGIVCGGTKYTKNHWRLLTADNDVSIRLWIQHNLVTFSLLIWYSWIIKYTAVSIQMNESVNWTIKCTGCKSSTNEYKEVKEFRNYTPFIPIHCLSVPLFACHSEPIITVTRLMGSVSYRTKMKPESHARGLRSSLPACTASLIVGSSKAPWPWPWPWIG